MEITESSPLIERAWYTFPIVVYGAWMVKKRIEVNLGVKSLYHAHSASKLLPILDLSLCVSLIMLAAGTTEIVGVAVFIRSCHDLNDCSPEVLVVQSFQARISA